MPRPNRRDGRCPNGTTPLRNANWPATRANRPRHERRNSLCWRVHSSCAARCPGKCAWRLARRSVRHHGTVAAMNLATVRCAQGSPSGERPAQASKEPLSTVSPVLLACLHGRDARNVLRTNGDKPDAGRSLHRSRRPNGCGHRAHSKVCTACHGKLHPARGPSRCCGMASLILSCPYP